MYYQNIKPLLKAALSQVDGAIAWAKMHPEAYDESSLKELMNQKMEIISALNALNNPTLSENN